MPMASFHQIDSNGDVKLVLLRPKEVVSPLDGVLECPPTPLPLSFRRSKAQEQKPNSTQGSKKDKKSRKRGQELHRSPWTFDEPLPEIVSEALEPGLYPGTPTIQDAEGPTIPEESSNDDLTGSTMVKDDATIILDENCLFIVSSKHLTLASSYFRRNLGSGMLESQTLGSQRHLEFPMGEKDPEALLIVLNIIHGRNRLVPRSVDLDMLTRLAVIVDYLECHEAIESFSDRWFDDLKASIPLTYSEALIRWLCISLVFHKERQFKAVTCTAMRQAKGPMQTLGLPIRQRVVEEIDRQRSYAIKWLLLALEELSKHLLHNLGSCTFECNAMRYGVLVMELYHRELLFPRPPDPYLGYSLENIMASVRTIQDPRWCDMNSQHEGWGDSDCHHHPCQLTSHITTITNMVDVSLKGLTL